MNNGGSTSTKTSDPKSLPKSSGGLHPSGPRLGGTVLATSFCPAQIRSAAVSPQMTNQRRRPDSSQAARNNGRTSLIIGLADIISGRCNRAIWPYAWFTSGGCGSNFFDNAGVQRPPQRKNGWVLVYREGRDKVFLMSKVCTHGRDKKVAMQHWRVPEAVGHRPFGTMQIHEVITRTTLTCISQRVVWSKRWMSEKAGQGTFVGFTGHKSPAIHLKMLAHDYPIRYCPNAAQLF